ncbi:MAG: hypothetical protein QOE70_6167 [Chthoniobacter sp.]|jgi:uncharacterized protein YwqG|nr:hypothetical protein [Chthoniobacter sp.]
MNLPPLPDELAPLAAFIQQSASPCIAVSVIPDGDVAFAGSKIGGAAALPAAFQWPRYKGKSLEFLLQLNLAELPNGVGFGLPGHGLLSFFYDLQERPWTPEIGGAFRVVYTPDEATLIATPAPENVRSLGEASLAFRAGLSLPYFSSTALGDFQERIQAGIGRVPSDDEMDDFAEAYGDYCREVSHFDDPNPDGGPHRMFGHPENIQDEMRAWDSEWVMLFQVASDDTIDLQWGDSGMLYFWITKADLAATRFDRVTLTLQCC